MSVLSDYKRLVEAPMIAKYEARVEVAEAERDAIKGDLERATEDRVASDAQLQSFHDRWFPVMRRMREALEKAERKLSAYVGVCPGDKELTSTLLPMCRAALDGAPASSPVIPDGWRSIESADKSIAVVMQLAPDVPAMLHSYPIWVRTACGEPREASWCQRKPDNPAGYWWDWDAEDVIDPDEWMPHPLDCHRAAAPATGTEVK